MKFFVWLFIVFFVAALTFLPQILILQTPSDALRVYWQKVLSVKLGYSVVIDRMTLAEVPLQTKLIFEGIRFYSGETNQKPIFSADRVTVAWPWWKCWRGQFELGDMSFEGVALSIERKPQGGWNFTVPASSHRDDYSAGSLGRLGALFQGLKVSFKSDQKMTLRQATLSYCDRTSQPVFCAASKPLEGVLKLTLSLNGKLVEGESRWEESASPGGQGALISFALDRERDELSLGMEAVDGAWKVSGVLEVLSRQPVTRLKGELHHFSLESFQKIFGQAGIALTGQAAGSFEIEGELSHPDKMVDRISLSGVFDVRQGTLGKPDYVREILGRATQFPASESDRFEILRGNVRLSQGRMQLSDVFLKAKTYTLSSEVDFSFKDSMMTLFGKLVLLEPWSVTIRRSQLREAESYRTSQGRYVISFQTAGSWPHPTLKIYPPEETKR